MAVCRNLAELKGVGALIPNQSTLPRGIMVQEAKVSSEIENIVTNNDSLYQAMSQDSLKLDPHTPPVGEEVISDMLSNLEKFIHDQPS
jgi:hypothetical protein